MISYQHDKDQKRKGCGTHGGQPDFGSVKNSYPVVHLFDSFIEVCKHVLLLPEYNTCKGNIFQKPLCEQALYLLRYRTLNG